MYESQEHYCRRSCRPVEYVVDDYTNTITVRFDDCTTLRLEFEEYNWVKNGKERYHVGNLGAPYELDRGGKTKEFPMFVEDSHFTDDTVMVIWEIA